MSCIGARHRPTIACLASRPTCGSTSKATWPGTTLKATGSMPARSIGGWILSRRPKRAPPLTRRATRLLGPRRNPGECLVGPRVDSCDKTTNDPGSERSFPQAAVAENLLDHVALAAPDEADDLHLTATIRALQRVNFIHAFDEHRPWRNAAGTGTVGSRLLALDRRTIDGGFV